MGKIGTKIATRAQIVAIGKLLDLHCMLVDGVAKYAEGWDDETVAAATGAPIGSVRNTRRELVGSIFKKKKPIELASEFTLHHPEVDSLRRQADDHGQLILNQHKRIEELVGKYNTVMETLSKYFGHELGVDFRSLMVSK